MVVDAKNIASQLGSSSFHIPEVTNPEFGFPRGYTPPERMTSPPPIRIPIMNLAAQDHYVASTRHASLYNEEDPRYAYYMPAQAAPRIIFVDGPLPNHVVKRLHALEEKFKAMEVHDTPSINIVDICLVPGLVIPKKIKVPDFKKYKGVNHP